MDPNPVIVWFVAGVVLILAEFALPGVILVFFGAGAWTAALAAALGLTPGLTGQLLTFAASSVVLLALLRRRLRARLLGHVTGGQDPATNLDDPAGEVVTVTVAIAPDRAGRVEYKGAEWEAHAGEALPAGSRAVVVAARGIVLEVRPLDPAPAGSATPAGGLA